MAMAWKGGDLSSGGKRMGTAAGFIGLGHYLEHGSPKTPSPDRIVHFGANDEVADIHEAMRLMEVVASTRPRVEKPVFHWGFSLAKDADGKPLETLTARQWEAVAYHSIQALGLEHHQVAWVVHDDAGHQHMHLVANRVPLDDGLKTWLPSNDHYKMLQTARWAEVEFGLSRHLNPQESRRLNKRTDREFRAVRRGGVQVPWHEALEPLRTAGSWDDLNTELAAAGFRLARPRRGGAGLVLHHRSGPVKALSALDEDLSGPKLRRRLDETPRRLGFVERRANAPVRGRGRVARTFWTDVEQELRRSSSWAELGDLLGRRGVVLEALPIAPEAGEPIAPEPVGFRLRHVASETARPLDEVMPGRMAAVDLLADRFGESWTAYQGRDPRPDRLPDPSEFQPLTVDGLVNRLEAHHGVWGERQARRVARAFPNGSEILERLHTSPRVLEVKPGTYTTRGIASLESEAFEKAAELRKPSGFEVTYKTHLELDAETREVVTAALGGEGLQLIEGPPGSGKTTLARAIAESYEAAGYEVIGASVTGKAAEGLRDETGIDSRTLASRRWTWKREDQGAIPPPARRRVILLDEASMLSLQDMAPLLRRAASKGYKVVMIGDRRQLSPVGAGDPFRRLIEDYGGVSLDRIRRQQVDWMREASQALIEGRVNESWLKSARQVRECLSAYDRHDRIHWGEKRSDSRRHLVDQWFADRQADPERSSLVLAYRNADVRRLNRRIRARRQAAGELQDGIRLYSQDFAVGDRILFRRNDRRHVRDEHGLVLPVQNGTLGTLVEASPSRMAVRLDNGKTAVFSPREYKDFVHGYAVTLHKAQGATVDRCYVLADRMLNRPGLTVAMTRHRRDLHLFGAEEDFESLEDLVGSASRRPPPDLIRDYRSDPEGLEPPTVPLVELSKPLGPYVSPIPRQIQVDAALKKMVEQLESRLDARPPSRSELGRIHEKVDDLVEQAHGLGWPARSEFEVTRLRAMADRLIRRSWAAEVLQVWREGSTEDCRRLLEAYDRLPPARRLPEPPPGNTRGVDGLNLPSLLEKRVNRLIRDADRYREAVESAPRPWTPVHDHWARRAEAYEERLAEAVKILERYTRLASADPSLPDWTLPALMETETYGGEAIDLEDRLMVLTEKSAAERPLDLDHQMAGVRWSITQGAEGAPPQADPEEPLSYWLHHQIGLDARVPETAYMEQKRKIGGSMDTGQAVESLETEMDELLREELPEIFRGKGYMDLLKSRDREAVLNVLKEEPGSLGSLQGWSRKAREKSLDKLEDLIAGYERRLKRCAELNDLQALHKASLEHRAVRKVLEPGSIEGQRENIYQGWQLLSAGERALLPPQVEKEMSRIRDGIAAHMAAPQPWREKALRHWEGRELELDDAMSVPFTMIPNPLKRLAHKQLTPLLPRPVRLALFLEKGLRRIRERQWDRRTRIRRLERHRGRDGGIGY